MTIPIISQYNHVSTVVLRSLVLMSEGHTMAEVAKELNLSSSSITIQMRNLEELLGKPIFVREGRRKYLTQYGEEVAKKATAILELNDSLFTA